MLGAKGNPGDAVLIVMLGGGEKSTQAADLAKAIRSTGDLARPKSRTCTRHRADFVRRIHE